VTAETGGRAQGSEPHRRRIDVVHVAAGHVEPRLEIGDVEHPALDHHRVEALVELRRRLQRTITDLVPHVLPRLTRMRRRDARPVPEGVLAGWRLGGVQCGRYDSDAAER